MFYDVSEDTILRGGGSLGLFSFCKVMTLYRVNPRQSSRARNRQFSWSKTIMAISNDADAAIIKATLTALQQLC